MRPIFINKVRNRACDPSCGLGAGPGAGLGLGPRDLGAGPGVGAWGPRSGALGASRDLGEGRRGLCHGPGAWARGPRLGPTRSVRPDQPRCLPCSLAPRSECPFNAALCPGPMPGPMPCQHNHIHTHLMPSSQRWVQQKKRTSRPARAVLTPHFTGRTARRSPRGSRQPQRACSGWA